MALTVEKLGLDRRTLRVLSTLLAAYVVYELRSVLALFVIAVLAAYVLRPIVDFVDERIEKRQRRTLALAVVYLVVVAVLGAVLGTVGYYAGKQATSLLDRAREMATTGKLPEVPVPSFLAPYTAELGGRLQEYVQSHTEEIVQAVSKGTLKLLSAAGNLLQVIVVLILSFFFLHEGSGVLAGFLAALPEERRAGVAAFLEDVNVALSTYVRSMILVALASAVLYWIGLSLLDVPYALLLALVGFPLEFIPFVGPLLAGALMVLVALFSGSGSALGVIVFLLALRGVQDYVLQPWLLGGGLSLSPLAMMFGVFAGEALAGIFGALLSVPVLAILRIAYLHLLADRELVSEEVEAHPSPPDSAAPHP